MGSGTEISIGDLATKIRTLMSSKIEIESDPKRLRPKNSEVFRLVCDNQKIKKLVKYKPSISIDEGLEKTINWLLTPNNLRKYKADIFNV